MPYRKVQFVLIDDNPMDLFFHDQLIRNHGMGDDIKSFEEAKKALDYFQAFNDGSDRYEETVVLLDLQMPELDGFGFLDYLGEMPSFILKKTWVIVVSSSIDEADRNRFNRHYFVKGAFCKPVDAEKLKSILDASPKIGH